MNRIVCLSATVALLSVLSISPVDAQQLKIYNGNISVQPGELRQDGDSLYLKMDLDIPVERLTMSSRKSLSLIPVLEGSKGRKAFPEVLINGKNRYKAYKRKIALDKKAQVMAPYAIIRKGKNSTLHYSQQIPYEQWMDDAHLVIVEDLCGCGGFNESSVQSQIFSAVTTDKIDIYVPQFQLAYIVPVAEQIKKRAEVKDVYLDFRVGSAVIYRLLNQNAVELQKVETMIKDVKNDGNVRITGLIFKGYASPEGSVTSNLRLSDNRARSMMNYLISQIDLKRIPVKAEGLGEDWSGLGKLLSESSIQDKDNLLDIIHQCGTTDVCEAKMRSVAGGVPYRQMVTEIYPQLRRTVCSVDYTVKEFSVEEGIEVIKTRPQQLSLNEMYLVANSYPAGSKEFNEVFETAVRMYPNDDVANLNAANSAIERGDLVYARKYLDKVKTITGEVENCLGVLYMLSGDYSNAESHLKAASVAGVKSAKHNLNELVAKQENDQLLKKSDNRTVINN